jgi:hypothetical protein
MATIARSNNAQALKKRTYYEEGRLFEDYVKRLFNENSFQLRKWRQSGSIPPDTFILDYSNPDLELVFVGKNRYPFAVECKWRSRFYKGKISWATKEQIFMYEEFQRKRAIPVFIAIGIGGTPSHPDRLFVTPLCNLIAYTDVSEQQLIPYNRRPTQRFFYDTRQLRLW